jgi:hypothetical protein
MAAGRDHVLAEAAGIEAGSWLHGPQRMLDTSSLLPNVDHSRRKQRHAGLWNWSVGHGSATCRAMTRHRGSEIPNRVYFLDGLLLND